jgi:hypothetical protein
LFEIFVAAMIASTPPLAIAGSSPCSPTNKRTASRKRSGSQSSPNSATNARLAADRLERDAQKALLAELAPRLEKLGQRVEELARQPLPPPMLAGTRAVEKGAEARVEDLAAMTGEQRAALLIKVAQTQPRALR